MKTPRRVLAAVADLFFVARITEIGKQTGVVVEVVEPARVLEACRAARPDLVVIDLEAPEAAAVIRGLRTEAATRELPVLGFYPHVRQELRLAALEAGANQVLPRSSFTVRLAELLAGEGHTSP